MNNKAYSDVGTVWELGDEDMRDILTWIELHKYRTSMQKSVTQMYDCLTKVMDYIPEDITLPPQLWNDIINAVEDAKMSGWVIQDV